MTMSYALFCSLCTIQDHPTIRLQVYHRTAAYIVQLGYGSGSAKCTCKYVCLTVLVLGPFWMNDWVWLRLVHLQPTDQRRVVMRMHLFLATDRDDVLMLMNVLGIGTGICWAKTEDILGCGSGLQSVCTLCANRICVRSCYMCEWLLVWAKRKQSAWFAQYYSNRAQ